MRRRGKGEASFLRCKSPGREEPDVTSRGRGMKGGERETKEGRRRRKKVETEVEQKKNVGKRRAEKGKEGKKNIRE